MNAKHFLLASLLLTSSTSLYAQRELITAPVGGNKKAAISEQIGITTVTLHYNRPGLKGREGKIWGTPVAHYGLESPGFATNRPAPWRAGANENTTIEFTDDVTIEGRPLPAGRYGVFMALGAEQTEVIFSKNSTSWGHYFYDPAEDVLRVTVKNQTLPQAVEWLRYEFLDQTDTSATVALEWEKRRIPFRVGVNVPKVQMASFARQLRNAQGFQWEAFVQAANYAVGNKIGLDQALEWANHAMDSQFAGTKNFQTLSAKANVLAALNRSAEADALMKEALPLGEVVDLHQYGRTLLSQKRTQAAFEVFKANYDKHPDVFTTNVGMGRAWAALGDRPKAITFFQAALPKATDAGNKANIETIIKRLQQGQDVN